MVLINIPGELMRLIFGSLLKEECDLELISWYDWFLSLLLISASIYLLLKPLMIYYSNKKSKKNNTYSN